MSNLNSEQYKEAQRQQEEWAKLGTELRRERLELQDQMQEREKAREMQRIDQHLEMVRKWRAKQGGEKAAGEPDQPAHDATQESQNWRPVGPNEILQPGAHVRMDMQTGQSQVQQQQRDNEAERPAEIIHFGASRPEPVTTTPARENTDARQAESATAENVEITDSKAAKKAALAQMRGETEQSIERGHERGYGHSR